jgi:hypothetical protein
MPDRVSELAIRVVRQRAADDRWRPTESRANLGPMKGQRGLLVLEALIDGVRPYLPPSVGSVRVRLDAGKGLQVWAVPSDIPEDADYGFVEVRLNAGGGSVQSRGPYSPFSFRSLIPLPGALRLRIEVTDALSLIQDAVQRVAGPWPESNATPRARYDGDDVLVWFQDTAGQRLLPEIRVTVP